MKKVGHFLEKTNTVLKPWKDIFSHSLGLGNGQSINGSLSD